MSSSFKRIAITGTTGFVGSGLMKELVSRYPDWEVLTLGRTQNAFGFPHAHWSFEDLTLADDEFKNIDVVIHLAARAHQLNERKASDLLSVYRDANVTPTIKLAEQAHRAGVKHFIHVSTIGVHGEKTENDAINEKSAFAPNTPYAKSKLEAEQLLIKSYAKTSMRITNVRPPLVYSAAAPGNFAKLLALASSKLPLPVASAKNKRNMIALENLVDFLLKLAMSTPVSNEDYVVADSEAVSLQDIISFLRFGQGRQAFTFHFPIDVMQFGAVMIGKKKMASQLFGSLEVSNEKACSALSWSPMISAKDALISTGQKFEELKTND